VVSWIPADSIPRKDGWKRASGHRNRSLPMVMTLEKTLACLKADDGYLSVGKFVGLFEGRGLRGSGHLLLEVESDVAELLFDVSDDFSLGGGGEGVTSLGEDLHEVISEISTGQVQSKDGVGKGVTFVDGDSVGDTISGIEDDTGGSTGSVQGKDGLRI
jgi:hypothetical protein